MSERADEEFNIAKCREVPSSNVRETLRQEVINTTPNKLVDKTNRYTSKRTGDGSSGFISKGAHKPDMLARIANHSDFVS